MGYAIYRVQPRSVEGARAMLRHALRERPVANAIGGAPPPTVLEGARTSAEAMQRLRGMVDACKAAKAWKSSVKPVLDVLVTFSREDGQRLTKEQQDAYFAQALEFAKQRYGADNLLSAVIHRDETTAHMQAEFVARYDGVKLSSSKLIGGKKGLSELQDDFYNQVGQKAGLQRGQKRSGAKHIPVRALYAAMNEGQEPPDFKPIPEKPNGWKWHSLSFEAKANFNKSVEEAIEHNNAERERIIAHYDSTRRLHPKLMQRQADRYRNLVIESDTLEKQNQEQKKELDAALSRQRSAEFNTEQARKVTQQLDKEAGALYTKIDRLREMLDHEQNHRPGSGR